MATAEPVRAYPLENQLCFALHAASRAMTSTYRPMLDELGITYPQLLVLLVLWERGDLPVNAVGKALQLETGTLSPLLKRLAAAGLITRTRRKDDERSVLIGLTPAGRALEARAIAVRESVGTCTGLDLPSRQALRSALQGLTAGLRAAAR